MGRKRSRYRIEAEEHAGGMQPLDSEQALLVARAYALYERWREQLAPMHAGMRRARAMRRLMQDERSATSPASNTLNSCADSVIADQIDNMPEARLIPEREETAKSAEEMTDVVSFVLYQAGWAGRYQQLMEDAVVAGTGVCEVYWDDEAMDGEGMVNVLSWHPEDFYPDPMAENLQEGRGCFKAARTTVSWVEEHYPQAKGYVQPDIGDGEEKEGLDPDARVTLLEYWYRTYDAEKRKNRVHMALLAGRALLYSTELDYGVAREGEFAEGVYAHGLYPFTLFKYRRVFREPFGTGLIHDYEGTQNAIDRYIKYIDDNARQSSVQRLFIRKGSGVNPDEIADLSRVIVEWEGSDIREVMQPVQASPINSQVYQMMQYLCDTMKQDSGQNQFTRGEGGLGVTAASAIEALQNAGGKVARWHTEQFKEAFREMVEQILWVLSEYMEPGRTLRIVGGWDAMGGMAERIVSLDAPMAQGDRLPKPAYTVRVQTQKNTPGQIQEANEFLLKCAEICAQYGQPLPPERLIGLMEGYRTKGSVLRAVRENAKRYQAANGPLEDTQQ